jgi:hypothetical protein
MRLGRACLVAIVLVTAACSGNSSTAPSAKSADLSITFTPDPIPGTASTQCANGTIWIFTVHVRELNGVGATVTSWLQQNLPLGVRDGGPAVYPASDFVNQFGSDRIGPNETKTSHAIGVCLSALSGNIQYTINTVDDQGNPGSFVSVMGRMAAR